MKLNTSSSNTIESDSQRDSSKPKNKLKTQANPPKKKKKPKK